MVDVLDMLCLSVMQISKSIGNYLHIGINEKPCLGYVAFLDGYLPLLVEVKNAKHA